MKIMDCSLILKMRNIAKNKTYFSLLFISKEKKTKSKLLHNKLVIVYYLHTISILLFSQHNIISPII